MPERVIDFIAELGARAARLLLVWGVAGLLFAAAATHAWEVATRVHLNVVGSLSVIGTLEASGVFAASKLPGRKGPLKALCIAVMTAAAIAMVGINLAAAQLNVSEDPSRPGWLQAVTYGLYLVPPVFFLGMVLIVETEPEPKPKRPAKPKAEPSVTRSATRPTNPSELDRVPIPDPFGNPAEYPSEDPAEPSGRSRSLDDLRIELAKLIKDGVLPDAPAAEPIAKALGVGLPKARKLRDELKTEESARAEVQNP
ncbi:hypothetical protein [Kineosporia succinea]|uniref:DUF2637 domain-containing protein n=1 Tax=Kineosporia succinea TaxID=84632 RepID=A0ABT9NZL2_9ACTN|nr:hypothetical protein [Kineosporia succinea]MDP9825260.1 hypothetical protein [Kineosporia succinea]